MYVQVVHCGSGQSASEFKKFKIFISDEAVRYDYTPINVSIFSLAPQKGALNSNIMYIILLLYYCIHL